jgi:hypothetical protein
MGVSTPCATDPKLTLDEETLDEETLDEETLDVYYQGYTEDLPTTKDILRTYLY